jgi:hypothetical protein
LEKFKAAGIEVNVRYRMRNNGKRMSANDVISCIQYSQIEEPTDEQTEEFAAKLRRDPTKFRTVSIF